MGWNVRGRALLVIWFLLALLPLRGWAHAGVHLPAAQELPASCHTLHEAADGVTASEDGAQPSERQHACALCDLCHGAALPSTGGSQRFDYAPPQVERAAAIELGASRAPDRRPPRT